jgi:hypothetical protein
MAIKRVTGSDAPVHVMDAVEHWLTLLAETRMSLTAGQRLRTSNMETWLSLCPMTKRHIRVM